MSRADASRVAAVSLAAAYKSDSDPLSVPVKNKSEALKTKLRKKCPGTLFMFVCLLAAASSSGFNPLAYAGEDTCGAFVASNLNELSDTGKAYLFITTLAHLRRTDPPLLAEYTRLPRKKDPRHTPMRWELEDLWLRDPATGQICDMWALLAAVQLHFAFTLTRKQMRKIFLYSTVKPVGLVYIDLPELLQVLKAQNVLGLNQHSTVAQMCDLLIAPFIHLFWTNRKQHRDALNDIDHTTEADMLERLAPMEKAKKAKGKGKGKKAAVAKKEKVTTTRKKLAAGQKAEAKVKRQQAAAEAAAAAPPSRSGKRKAVGAQAKAPKKAKTVAATVEPNPCASIGLSAPGAPVLASPESKAEVDEIDGALLPDMEERPDDYSEKDEEDRAKEQEIIREWIALQRAGAALINHLQRTSDEAYDEDDAVATAPGNNDNSDILATVDFPRMISEELPFPVAAGGPQYDDQRFEDLVSRFISTPVASPQR